MTAPVGCQSRDLACPQARRIPPSPPKKVVPCFDVVPFLYIVPILQGFERERLLNDSPVGCQSRDLACPQTRRIPPSPPKSGTTFRCGTIFCFILNRR